MFSGQSISYKGVKVIADAKPFKAGDKDLVEIRIAYNPGGERYESQFADCVFNPAVGSFKAAADLKKGAVISVDGTLQLQKGKDGGAPYLKIPFPTMLVVHSNGAETDAAKTAPVAAPAATAKVVTRRAKVNPPVEDTSDIPF